MTGLSVLGDVSMGPGHFFVRTKRPTLKIPYYCIDAILQQRSSLFGSHFHLLVGRIRFLKSALNFAQNQFFKCRLKAATKTVRRRGTTKEINVPGFDYYFLIFRYLVEDKLFVIVGFPALFHVLSQLSFQSFHDLVMSCWLLSLLTMLVLWTYC